MAMGQDSYKRTLLKPRLMPKTPGKWCEPLLYAAQSAWQRKTGEEVDFETKVSFESGSNEALWPPEKERDWRQEAMDKIKSYRREARTCRANANKSEYENAYLQVAKNFDRMAEVLEKKLRGEQK
jgi:hypothetical protein